MTETIVFLLAYLGVGFITAVVVTVVMNARSGGGVSPGRYTATHDGVDPTVVMLGFVIWWIVIPVSLGYWLLVAALRLGDRITPTRAASEVELLRTVVGVMADQCLCTEAIFEEGSPEREAFRRAVKATVAG